MINVYLFKDFWVPIYQSTVIGGLSKKMLKVGEIYIQNAQNAMHFQGGKNSFMFGAHWRLSAESGIWLRARLGECWECVGPYEKLQKSTYASQMLFKSVIFFPKVNFLLKYNMHI